MRPNIKKLDDVDVVFVDTPWTAEETKALSDYIRKQKLLMDKKTTIASSSKPETDA